MVTSTMTSPSTPEGRSARDTGGSGKTSGKAGATSSPVKGEPGTRPQGEPPRAVCSGAFCRAGWSVFTALDCVLDRGVGASEACNDGRCCSGEAFVRSGPTGARYTMETEPEDPGIP